MPCLNLLGAKTQRSDTWIGGRVGTLTTRVLECTKSVAFGCFPYLKQSCFVLVTFVHCCNIFNTVCMGRFGCV